MKTLIVILIVVLVSGCAAPGSIYAQRWERDEHLKTMQGDQALYIRDITPFL